MSMEDMDQHVGHGDSGKIITGTDEISLIPDKISEFDFSHFHDLGHQWFTKYCSEQYGGWKNHVQLWWTYIGQDRYVYQPWHDLTKRHTASEIYKTEGKLVKNGGTGITATPTGKYDCFYCAISVDSKGKVIKE